MDVNDRYDYDYNRSEIEKRLEKLCAAARGTDISILPYINDAKGNFSEKKAVGFINELLRTGGLKGKEAGFYKAFLYCSLRCFANDRIYYFDMYDRFRPCSTFQDILNKAKLVDCDRMDYRIENLDDLMLFEYQVFDDPWSIDESVEENSFFITMDSFYVWLTGKDYRTLDSDGFERFFGESGIFALYEKRNDEWYSRECEDIADAVNVKPINEGSEGNTADIGMEDEEYRKEVDRINRLNRPDWDRFKEGFKDVDRFTEMYRKYRELYFEVEHPDLYDRIGSMIYSFMYDKKLSICVSDEAVVDELSALDDISAQLQAAIKRSRRRNGL